MGIKVHIGDVYADLPTVAEAAEFVRLLGKSSGKATAQASLTVEPPQRDSLPKQPAPQQASFEVMGISAFAADLHESPKRLLATLVQFPGGITTEELAQRLGVATASIGGTCTAISKNARKRSVAYGGLIHSESKIIDGKRATKLYPETLLKENAALFGVGA